VLHFILLATQPAMFYTKGCGHKQKANKQTTNPFQCGCCGPHCKKQQQQQTDIFSLDFS